MIGMILNILYFAWGALILGMIAFVVISSAYEAGALGEYRRKSKRKKR